MLTALSERALDPQLMTSALIAIATAATIWTLAAPFLEGESLEKRMKTVAIERDRIRARERERMAKAQQKPSLRQQPKVYMRQVVDGFKLDEWLGTDTAKAKLLLAGYRGQNAEVAFLFFRLVSPLVFFAVAGFYLFVLEVLDQPVIVRVGLLIVALYVGVKAPEIFLSNQTGKRQASIRSAWPDALDLLLICVESGMSVEAAFKRVSDEVGTASIPLAEELTLTTAELSYLPDRRQAYENLALRTGLESVKAITTALVQAERYGTPLGQALRTLAQESRDIRMNEAEKKAAALPPKLTVPMILFFLPALFVVILTPALIQVMGWK
ncbi:MAG TPA: type II secretion system F family protein [Beijerinckiaceae bacterium]|nr:type II secretion system F family protein [Beijerinckiaceae bacterium]